MAYPFLSDEWIEAARAIRSEYEDRAPAIPFSVRMNQVITQVPFGDGLVHAHLDTSSGHLELELGHLADPDVTITLAWDTAKSILIEADAEAAMGAFLGGRIRVDGDITKLLSLQTSGVIGGGGVEPLAREVHARLEAITE